MNLDPAPRLNKTPFFVTVAVCLTAVVLIGFFAPDKFAPLPFVSALAFLLISIIAAMIPIIIDYGADSAEYVQAERGRVTDQVQRLHAATESLGRAAAQIKAVEESVHKTAHAAENLPYRMQEKLAEFNEALAAKDNEEREALERELDELRAASSDNLKAVADKIAKAAADWSGLEATSRKQLAALSAEASRVQQEVAAFTRLKEDAQDAAARLNTELRASLALLDARVAALQQTAASIPTTVTIAAPVAAVHDRRSASDAQPDGGHRPPLSPEPAAPEPAAAVTPAEPASEIAPARPEPTEGTRPEPVEGVIESVTLSETAAPFPGENKPKKPRASRKPRPEDTLAAMSAESLPPESVSPAAPAPTPAAASTEPAEPSALDQSVENPAQAEASVSSDGATRLLVTAYIGIGNKLFIRGDGPGLSWDKGVPMQFVSIGKWGWAATDVTAPIACKLYKNDETAALSGEILVEPGRHVELTALF